MSRFRFPFKTLLVMAALSYVLVDNPPLRIRYVTDSDQIKQAEFYPLSSFPMYSTFSDSPFLVYVTGADGRPVAIEHSLKTHASELKKTYEARLKALKKEAGQPGRLMEVPLAMKAEAGRQTLELLKSRPPVQAWLATRPDPLLRLHEIILTAGDDGIERGEQIVAEL